MRYFMPHSRATIVLALLLTLAGLTACRSSGSGPSTSSTSTSTGTGAAASPTVRPSTTVHTLAPVSSRPAGAARAGSCFTTSITVARAHAYRCFVGNEILDPCYVGGSRSVTCYADPWSAPIAVRLTKALPAGPPMAVHRPWAIVLTGQIRCLAATGIVPVVHGTALTYTCLDGGSAALTGPASAALRTALYRPTSGAPLRPITVTDVWAG